MGGGVVDGLLFDSFEMDPRVRFCPRCFGSEATGFLLINFFSNSFNSFGVCGRVLVLVLCGVAAFGAAPFQIKNKNRKKKNQIE